MDIYKEIYNKIINLKFDTVNRKIYKPILILSYIEYLKDNNCSFGTSVSIYNLLDFISIYIERDDLIPYLIDDKDQSILDLKKNKYQSYEKKIVTRFRQMPLSKIVNDNSGYLCFKTNFGTNTPKSRKLKDLPNEFKIEINHDFKYEKMITTISKACRDLIYKISNVKITGDIVYEINRNLENKLITVQNDEYNALDINTKKILITPRKGQNIYRKRILEKFNNKCVLCDLDIKELLIASHAKPWSKCDNIHERLTCNNGLLLCANHDKLFDSGLITIDLKNNKVLVSKSIDTYKIDTILTGIKTNIDFNFDYKFYKYMLYHNEKIFKNY